MAQRPVPPSILHVHQGPALLGWRPSYRPGSSRCVGGRVHPPTPGPLSFPAALIYLGCLPAHPSASGQAWNGRTLMPSKREGGWGQASASSKRIYLGAGATGTPSQKNQRLEDVHGWDKEKICSESVSRHERCACTDRGLRGQISWGWGQPFSQTAVICRPLGTLGSAGLKKSY